MAIEVRIPHLGESVTEAVIARWLRQDGEPVEADEPVLEIETEKAAMEVVAEAKGRLHVLQPAGARVQAGTVVARIVTEAPAEAPAAGAAAAPRVGDGPRRADAVAAHASSPEAERRVDASRTRDPVAASSDAPAERARHAPQEEVRARDSAHVARDQPGRPDAVGEGGAEPERARSPEAEPTRRATLQRPPETERARPAEPPRARPAGSESTTPAEPPRARAESESATPAEPEHAGARENRATPADAERARPADAERTRAMDGRHLRVVDGDIERVPMSEIRRTIAARLVESQRNAAILTTFNEVDVSEVMAVRARYRERFKARYGVDLGLMSLFARATVGALGEFPILNARIDGTDIVYHRRVHLGIAVATPRGLVVPVVRDAGAMTLAELERAIADVAGRARATKLRPDDLTGGTFSITNGGVFGSLLSTPLLNPPQSGILGMHRIQERPVAVAGQVVIRPVMYVALSYDHRLVDGEQAVRFLVRVKEQIEEPSRMLLEV